MRTNNTVWVGIRRLATEADVTLWVIEGSRTAACTLTASECRKIATDLLAMAARLEAEAPRAPEKVNAPAAVEPSTPDPRIPAHACPANKSAYARPRWIRTSEYVILVLARAPDSPAGSVSRVLAARLTNRSTDAATALSDLRFRHHVTREKKQGVWHYTLTDEGMKHALAVRAELAAAGDTRW